MKKNLLLLFFLVFSNAYSAGVGEIISATRYNGDTFVLGSVQTSILSESAFREQAGDCWVLMDGRTLSNGEDLIALSGATIPDSRGQFLRAKNNGRNDGKQNPDGELALGSQQMDEVGKDFSLSNVTSGGSQSSTSTNRSVPNTGSSARLLIGWSGSGYLIFTNTDKGGNETRSKNITVNFFIKVNNSCNSVL